MSNWTIFFSSTYRTCTIIFYILFLFLVACPQNVFCTEYYINADTGNDENTGTSPETPWKTLKKANNANLKPGDQLLFACGCTWHGQLIISTSGLEKNPIIIDAYGIGPLPIISGGEKIEGWKQSIDENIWECSIASTRFYPYWLSRENILLTERNNIEKFDNLEWFYDKNVGIIYLKDTSGNPDQTGKSIETGFYTQPVFINGDYIYLANLHLIGGNARTLYLKSCEGIKLKNLILERGGIACLQISGASNIYGDTINIQHINHGPGIYLNISDATFYNTTVKDAQSKSAIKTIASNLQLNHSIIIGNRFTGIMAKQNSQVFIENCVIIANGFSFDFGTNDANLYADDTSELTVSYTLLDGYGWSFQHLQKKTVGHNAILFDNNLLNIDPKLRAYSANEGIISITVDDYDIDYVEDIIEAIKPYNASMSFFVVQRAISFVQDYQNRLKAIINNGSEIGCHSYSHPYLAEPIAFSLQYLSNSPATLTISDDFFTVDVLDHPEHSLALSLTSADIDDTKELINYLNSFMGGGIFKAINLISDSHNDNGHKSKSTDLSDIQNISINLPYIINFDPERFYQTQLLEPKLWLENLIGFDYEIKTFAAPYGSTNDTVRKHLLNYGYIGQRSASGLPIWNTRNLNDIFVFGVASISPASFHNRGESWIRSFARHLALLSLEKGMIITLLTHIAEDFLPEEYSILVDELSKFSGIHIMTFSNAMEYIQNSGYWEKVDSDGMHWRRDSHDVSQYVPCSNSPLIDIDAGLHSWVKTNLPLSDIDGDGDIDVLGASAASSVDDDISWWENLDGSGTSWTKHIVDGDFWNTRSVYAEDIDRDGDMDILGASYNECDIAWWENLNGSCTVYDKHLIIDGDFPGATSVYMEDINGDGIKDVIGASLTWDLINWWDVVTYPPEGSLISSVLDTGCSPLWNTINWYSTEPLGTSLGFQVRSSSDPDSSAMGSWCDTLYSPCSLEGILVDEERYIQYRAILETSDLDTTAVLHEVTLSWNPLGIQGEGLPQTFELLSVYPNPSSGSPTVTFAIPECSSVGISIYDLSGRMVTNTSTEEYSAGYHTVTVNEFSPGIYFCRISFGDVTSTRSFVVVE